MPVLLLNYYRPYTSWLKNVTVFLARDSIAYAIRPSVHHCGQTVPDTTVVCTDSHIVDP